MARTQDLNFNGNSIELNWATEETLQKLENSNESSAKLLAGILKSINDSEKVDKLIHSALKKMNSSVDTMSDDITRNASELSTKEIMDRKRQAKADQQEQTRIERANTKFAKETSNELNRSIFQLKNSFSSEFGNVENFFKLAENSINTVINGLRGSLAKFTNFAGKLPGIGLLFGGISAAIGFVVGQMEMFSTSIMHLTDSGAAFGIKLIDLRKYAGNASMSMDEFAKMISENSKSLRGLGLTSDNYLEIISNELSSFLQKAGSDFNYFGMTISELNQIMMDEMSIRQRSGQLLGNSQMNLTESLNELLYQTSAMAKVTGQSRREMFAARTDVMSDPMITSYAATLGDTQRKSLDIFSASFSGIITPDVMKAITSSLATGINLETFMKDTVGYTQAAMGSEFINTLYLIQSKISNGTATEKDLAEVLGSLRGISVNEPAMASIRSQASIGNADALKSLAIIEELRPFIQDGTKTNKEIETMLRLATQDMKDTDAIALPAELQKFSNNLKTSFAMSAADFAGFLGVDYDNLYSSAVNHLESLNKILTDESGNVISAQEAATNILNDMIDSLDTDDILFKIYNSISGGFNWLKTNWPSALGGMIAPSDKVDEFRKLLKNEESNISNVTGPRDNLEAARKISRKNIEDFLNNNPTMRYEIAGDAFGYTPSDQAKSLNQFISNLTPTRKPREINPNLIGPTNFSTSANIPMVTDARDTVDFYITPSIEKISKLINNNSTNLTVDQLNPIIDEINSLKEVSIGTYSNGNEYLRQALVEYNNMLGFIRDEIKHLRDDSNLGNRKAVSAFQEGPQ